MTYRGFFRAGLGFIIATITALSANADYKLGVSDRLKIKVYEWPDLAGEYSVNADGVVSLPIIGDVSALGISVTDFAREISLRLQQRAAGSERPSTSAEVVYFRPFFVVGDVQKPGDYPYRPGLTVLQALGIAGGFYRPIEPGMLRLDRDIAVAQGEVELGTLKSIRLLARSARLSATLAEAGEITFPVEFSNARRNPDLSIILENERATFAVERKLVQQEAQSLDDLRSLYQKEIASLLSQSDAHKKEMEIVQRQLESMRQLSAKGLALAPTVFSLERIVAQIGNEQLSVNTAIVRARQNITLAENKAREQIIERSRIATKDLLQTNDELGEVRARISTARDLLDEAQIKAPNEARSRLTENGKRMSFSIVRREGDLTREFPADEMTTVEPGDVIKVPAPNRRDTANDANLNFARDTQVKSK